jgi:hypothetical protein
MCHIKSARSDNHKQCTFDYMLSTDGVGVSLQFVRKDKVEIKANMKEKRGAGRAETFAKEAQGKPSTFCVKRLKQGSHNVRSGLGFGTVIAHALALVSINVSFHETSDNLQTCQLDRVFRRKHLSCSHVRQYAGKYSRIPVNEGKAVLHVPRLSRTLELANKTWALL